MEQLKCQLETNNWDIETYKNKLKMIFFSKIVLTYWEKSCSNDREKLLKFAKFLRSLRQSIRTVNVKNNFETECFFTCPWTFPRSNYR